MAERRAFPRSPRRLDVHFVVDGARHVAVTRDVAVTGLFILSSVLPPPGTKVAIEVRTASGEVLHLQGIVARAQRAPAALSSSFPTGFGVALAAYNEPYERLISGTRPPSGEFRSLKKKSDSAADMFTVSRTSAAKISAAAPPPLLDVGLIRVLLVDPSEGTFRTVRDAIARIEIGSFKVDWAESYKAGVAGLAEKRHDVCLVSFKLGAESGRTFVREAREIGKKVPLILLVPHRDRSLEVQVLREGAADVLEISLLDADRLERAIRYSLERARSQSELESTLKEFRDIYHRAPCGFHTLDTRGLFTHVNDTELVWLGYTREELVGARRFQDLLSASAARVFEERHRWLLERGSLRNLELDLVRKDGSTLPALSSAAVVEVGGEKRSRWTILDITERRRAETSLRRLAKAIETMQIGVTIKDLSGTILYVNPAAAAMTGYTADELQGMNARVLSPPELHRDLSDEEVRDVTRWSRESTNVRKDGTMIPVRLVSDLVTDSFGNPVGIVTCSEALARPSFRQ